MRVAKAQRELTEQCKAEGFGNGTRETEDRLMNERRRQLQEKYDIPPGVYLFEEGMEGALLPEHVKLPRAHLHDFVKGKMTDDTFNDLEFYFEEHHQCDWSWIMNERPLYYYDAACEEDAPDMDKERAELRSIGTRSRSKNKRPPIVSLQMNARAMPPAKDQANEK